MLDIFKRGRKPDFINELGVKWWKQPLPSRVKTAKLKKQIRWFYIEVPHEEVATHLILRDDEIIFESQQLDSVYSFLDLLPIIEE
jgi:hypothetical protein